MSGDTLIEATTGEDAAIEAGFEARAPAPGLTATLVPATLATLAAAVVVSAAAVALAGAVAMAIGVPRGSRRLHTTGAGLTFGGVLLAGAAGASPLLVVFGAAAALVAWDAGEHAVGLAHQVGAESPARRNVLAHVGATSLAAIGIAALTAGVYLLASAGQPGAAAGILAIAGALFALLIDR